MISPIFDPHLHQLISFKEYSNAIFLMSLQSCRNFNDSGMCVEYCPPERIYNSVTWQWDENPHAKFAYRNTCIRDCRTGVTSINAL